ncbi:DUF1254 domain-containing protein [Mycolicibacterium llatzerense]|uniref:DUF1254 domain-containing protein n=1 Tax=Mycolicibacterium llatzerense TaxID=280871 RepID=UPI0021B6B157|nr:DUF1254 domain-containing protein [Mycolicibacterium llatzerense]
MGEFLMGDAADDRKHRRRRSVRLTAVCLGAALAAAALVGCGTSPSGHDGSATTGTAATGHPNDPSAGGNADAQAEEHWAYSVGIQNYVFGLPLSIFERERSLRLEPPAGDKAKRFAPLNQITHMKNLATADDVMPYTPNNDTVYSGIFLELKDEPMILTAPDIPDRYWSVEVADAYTNNLFYIGSRATAGKGGNHVLVGPNWQGSLPPGVIEHRVPTNSVMIAIRIAVIPGDAADLAKVNALQDKFSVTSLGNWADPARHGQSTVPSLSPRPHYEGDLAFFQTLADLLTENPHPRATRRLSSYFAEAGSQWANRWMSTHSVNRSGAVWRAPPLMDQRSWTGK